MTNEHRSSPPRGHWIIKRGRVAALTYERDEAGQTFTGWTFEGKILDGEGGQTLFALSVVNGAEATVTADAADTTTLQHGVNKYWFEVDATPPGGQLTAIEHGPVTVEG